MEELLRVVGLGCDMHAFAELEHRLQHRGGVGSRAGDQKSVVLRGTERIGGELVLDRAGETAHVLAHERATGRDRARVARGVAVALLELGVATTTWSTSRARGLSPAPVTSHVSPPNASTASLVNWCRPHG